MGACAERLVNVVDPAVSRLFGLRFTGMHVARFDLVTALRSCALFQPLLRNFSITETTWAMAADVGT